MAIYFQDFIYYLDGAGVYDYVLPFLLVFTIIFAILEKTKLFGTEGIGKPKTNINAVLAIVIALIVMVNTEITDVINSYLSKMALFIIVALIFILAIGIFGADAQRGFSGIPLLLFILISVIAVVWALTPTLGVEFPFHLSDQDKAVIFFLIVFFLVIAFVTRGTGSRSHGFMGVVEDIVRGFKGGKP